MEGAVVSGKNEGAFLLGYKIRFEIREAYVISMDWGWEVELEGLAEFEVVDGGFAAWFCVDVEELSG